MTFQWFLVLLISALALPGWSQDQPDILYPITPRLVARALTNSGMQTADEQVSLSAHIVATEPYPALDILSVEPLNYPPSATATQPRSTVKLACHAPAACVPFFAIVEGLQPAITSANLPGPLSAQPKDKLAITIHAGAHAILVMDDQRAHIQVAVVSLENGATGKWIRVASPDHKQTYWGEVVSADRLRGSF